MKVSTILFDKVDAFILEEIEVSANFTVGTFSRVEVNSLFAQKTCCGGYMLKNKTKKQ